jgi:uncharacterized membrane protein required for colicin V production
MIILLDIISVLWIVAGVLLILYTEETRAVLRKVLPRENIRWLAAFPLIFGVTLSIGAFYVREMLWLVLVLGILGIAKGIYLLAGPITRINALLQWWIEKADAKTVRLFGLITFTLGSGILLYLI